MLSCFVNSSEGADAMGKKMQTLKGGFCLSVDGF